MPRAGPETGATCVRRKIPIAEYRATRQATGARWGSRTSGSPRYDPPAISDDADDDQQYAHGDCFEGRKAQRCPSGKRQNIDDHLKNAQDVISSFERHVAPGDRHDSVTHSSAARELGKRQRGSLHPCSFSWHQKNTAGVPEKNSLEIFGNLKRVPLRKN
jgi:hypothetical protein